MKPRPSARKGIALGALVLGLVAVLAASGCALLLPPAWRGRAPVPLAGPIEASDLDGAAQAGDDLAELTDEALAARVSADQERLVELASASGRGPLASSQAEAELREIADRLPRMQRELERRGRADTLRTQHPVIR